MSVGPRMIDYLVDNLQPMPLAEVRAWLDQVAHPAAVSIILAGPKAVASTMSLVTSSDPDRVRVVNAVLVLVNALHICRLTRDLEDAQARIAELEVELQLRDAGEPPEVALAPASDSVADAGREGTA